MDTDKIDIVAEPDDLALDTLYAAWKDDRQSAFPVALREWTAQYPSAATELTQWTAAAGMLQCEEDLDGSAIDRTEASTVAIGKAVLAERRARYSVVRSFIDIYAAARDCGMTPRSLGIAVGVGLPIIAKLQQRLIRFASLPTALIEALASALQVSATQVRDYLSQPASLAVGASYKSNAIPHAAEQEEFAEAIRACPDMTAEQKSAWLSRL